MFNAQVSSKGQVVIPKPLRERWGIEEGSTVSFTEDVAGLHLSVQPPSSPDAIAASLDEGLGLAKYDGPSFTPAEIREGIDSAFKKGSI